MRAGLTAGQEHVVAEAQLVREPLTPVLDGDLRAEILEEVLVEIQLFALRPSLATALLDRPPQLLPAPGVEHVGDQERSAGSEPAQRPSHHPLQVARTREELHGAGEQNQIEALARI